MEAFAAFCLPFTRHIKNKSIEQFIRTENETELFFNGDTQKDISITIGEDSFRFSYSKDSMIPKLSGFLNDKKVIEINKRNVKSSGFYQQQETIIKSYFFKTPFYFEDTPLPFLQPTNAVTISRT